MQYHKTEIRFKNIITAFIVRSFPKRRTNCHMKNYLKVKYVVVIIIIIIIITRILIQDESREPGEFSSAIS